MPLQSIGQSVHQCVMSFLALDELVTYATTAKWIYQDADSPVVFRNRSRTYFYGSEKSFRATKLALLRHHPYVAFDIYGKEGLKHLSNDILRPLITHVSLGYGITSIDQDLMQQIVSFPRFKGLSFTSVSKVDPGAWSILSQHLIHNPQIELLELVFENENVPFCRDVELAISTLSNLKRLDMLYHNNAKQKAALSSLLPASLVQLIWRSREWEDFPHLPFLLHLQINPCSDVLGLCKALPSHLQTLNLTLGNSMTINDVHALAECFRRLSQLTTVCLALWPPCTDDYIFGELLQAFHSHRNLTSLKFEGFWYNYRFSDDFWIHHPNLMQQNTSFPDGTSFLVRPKTEQEIVLQRLRDAMFGDGTQVLYAVSSCGVYKDKLVVRLTAILNDLVSGQQSWNFCQGSIRSAVNNLKKHFTLADRTYLLNQIALKETMRDKYK